MLRDISPNHTIFGGHAKLKPDDILQAGDQFGHVSCLLSIKTHLPWQDIGTASKHDFEIGRKVSYYLGCEEDIDSNELVFRRPNSLLFLSWEALLFLIERTDYHEPWMGIGFATTLQNKIVEAAKIKAGDDPIRIGIIENIKSADNKLIRWQEEIHQIEEFVRLGMVDAACRRLKLLNLLMKET